ncbi:MAG: imidazole glycerol phosphate synthase, glutamine amidotransferase subunit, partial [Desulfobacula sp. RIFOXYB2_FULL_45_6]
MIISLLDYGAGNVRSVVNAVEKIGGTVKEVKTPSDIRNAERLLFPGVGNYENMIKILNQKNFIVPLRKYLQADRPFLGICLGMQALFEGSEEDFSGNESIGIFKGSVKRFKTRLAVPHIGWNGVNLKKDSPVFKGIGADTKFYFVHS